MKRFKVLVVLICALMLVLSGCDAGRVVAENPYYAVVKKADGYYINFKPGLEEKVEGFDPKLLVTSAVELRDIRSMRDGLLNATMESGCILHLKMLIAFDEDSAKICDLNNLYEPVLPQSIQSRDFEWRGEVYGFNAGRQNGECDIQITVYPETEYEELYRMYNYLDHHYIDWAQIKFISIIDNESDPSRFVYTRKTIAGEEIQYETVKYYIEADGRQYTVLTTRPENVQGAKEMTTVFVRQEGLHYIIRCSADSSQALTQEEITSIRLVRLED